MAGRHARKAPVVISRAVATLAAAAALLAVGVVAMTLFTSGERPATGGGAARAPGALTGPTAIPTLTTEAPPGPGPSAGPTPVPESGGATGGASESGSGWTFSRTDASRGPGTPTGPVVVVLDLPTDAGPPASVPDLAPDIASAFRGWWQRGEAGREHGKAVGLRRRLSTGHGCRPIASRARLAAARVEPAACR
jgi:hypothetical protein